MAHHLAGVSGDQRSRVSSWLTVWAPWMPPEELARLIEAVISKPLRWRAETLAKRLNLTEVDRCRLRITTIGAVDMTKAEREAARKVRKRQAMREKRRTSGTKPRAEYLAQSTEQAKPWMADGISRRTWYRHQRKAG
jgi:hypothetical protein